MNDVFSFHRGELPLLVSIPHDGRKLAPGMRERMTDTALKLPDTDWHVKQLYAGAQELGASVLSADYSRYVVDLNRAADDASLYGSRFTTGLCPSQTFAGESLYTDGSACPAAEQQRRIATYWQPYHDKIDAELRRIKAQFGYALLWDAHSIASEVPLLFDGRLPDLNFGTNSDRSCDLALAAEVVAAAHGHQRTTVLNGRFKGGYITRHYGNPAANVHAIQLELAQGTYMNEASGEMDPVAAPELIKLIEILLRTFVRRAQTLA